MRPLLRWSSQDPAHVAALTQHFEPLLVRHNKAVRHYEVMTKVFGGSLALAGGSSALALMNPEDSRLGFITFCSWVGAGVCWVGSSAAGESPSLVRIEGNPVHQLLTFPPSSTLAELVDEAPYCPHAWITQYTVKEARIAAEMKGEDV
jgi:hypothetical protein